MVVAIDELVTPVGLSYWNSVGGTEVSVNGARARWVKALDALVVTKGEMVVRITFPTEESQIPGSETPPPAGAYEAGAMRILQKVARSPPLTARLPETTKRSIDGHDDTIRQAVRTSVHRLTAVAVALVVVACGGIASTPTNSSALPATTSPALSQTVPSPSAMSASPSSGLLSWTYVALGDSWPAGGHCGGCRPFPRAVPRRSRASTGRRVDFVDFTNAGTAKSLLQDVRTSVTVRDAIRRADIVMISTGGNDLEPALVAASAGTCGGEDQLDCFRDVVAPMRRVLRGDRHDVTTPDRVADSHRCPQVLDGGKLRRACVREVNEVDAPAGRGGETRVAV